MVSGGFVLVFLLFAVALPVVLWLLIESETDDTTVTDRERAERAARTDTREQAERRARRDTGGEWGRSRRE